MASREIGEESNSTPWLVIDTGSGFSCHQQPGVGVENIRERMRLLYGERGNLVLEENRPHGVRAIVEVPGYVV